ncbi:hypothetical protein KPH14_006414 [Odynerus spinipes]|uniref:Uncharacterized protein n=1 Tax=Odynerus spinipes TaxID=1348599 RepID=A0AAD9VVM0_9HYME|nr:hypothetical protein KPH14_006414 [Odynerus spinipes]
MQESAAYMPSLQHDAVALTKSVCSSASSRCYFKSCNTLTELNEELEQTQTDSLINDQIVEKPAERRRTVKHSRQPREVSKSDSKIESGRDKT